MNDQLYYDFEQAVRDDEYKWIPLKRVVEKNKIKYYEELPSQATEWALSHDYNQTLLPTTYHPLENSALFLEFAETEPTKEGIVKFASDYGLLGSDIQTEIYLEGDIPYTGELETSWSKEILLMKEAVDLWELARKGETKAISQYETKLDYRSLYSKPSTIGGGFRRANLSEDGQWLNPHDVIRSTYNHIQHIINLKLENRVTPALLWLKGQSNKLSLQYDFPGLVGILWLQFAQAVAENRKFRSCEKCGTRFALTPQEARTNKRYCTDSCKFKAYREKKSLAIQKYNNGKGLSVEEIGNQLGSDIKTVRGWLKLGKPAISDKKE